MGAAWGGRVAVFATTVAREERLWHRLEGLTGKRGSVSSLTTFDAAAAW